MHYLVRNPTLDDNALSEFNFTVTNESGEEIELIPNGSNIPLTLKNREHYGLLLAGYYLKDEIKEEMQAFTEGFHDVIPLKLVTAFDTEELELIIGGTPYIDIEDWRINTQYSGEFHEKHRVILWFWELLEKLS